MAQVRIVVEYTEEGCGQPTLRWERTAERSNAAAAPDAAATGSLATFELLGRAFEVVQREEGAGFSESVAAFFRGALVRKEDLADVLTYMDRGESI